LSLTPYDAGPKVRAYHTLHYLAQQNEVTLLAFTRPDDRVESIDILKEFCTDVHTIPIKRNRAKDATHLLISLLVGRSFVIQRDYVPEMARKVDELLSPHSSPFSPSEERGYEAVHADQLWMAQYALRQKVNCQE